ncbi:hypothetical protein JL721_4111 [Aureococcus anophagefferens]|nr:hypothetical protein JL721_4111 [Aureococcus anophagefferens]
MRYEVVARKGLLLREGYATDSDKVCEARKGSFVVALGPQRDVGGVCRLAVVTPEGCGAGAASRRSSWRRATTASSRAPRRPWPSSSSPLSSRAHRELAIEQLMFMGGERGAAGARAARGLVAIASSASGFEARLRAAVFESCPASDEPSSAELAATLDELLAELTDPDATLKRFDAYDALVAEADRAARDAVPGLEAAVAQARFGDDFPSGPRQGGRVPGIPSLFLVPAGDPLVKEFLARAARPPRATASSAATRRPSSTAGRGAATTTRTPAAGPSRPSSRGPAACRRKQPPPFGAF